MRFICRNIVFHQSYFNLSSLIEENLYRKSDMPTLTKWLLTTFTTKTLRSIATSTDGIDPLSLAIATIIIALTEVESRIFPSRV